MGMNSNSVTNYLKVSLVLVILLIVSALSCLSSNRLGGKTYLTLSWWNIDMLFIRIPQRKIKNQVKLHAWTRGPPKEQIEGNRINSAAQSYLTTTKKRNRGFFVFYTDDEFPLCLETCYMLKFLVSFSFFVLVFHATYLK